MGLGSGGGGDEAERARNDEEERQRKIRLGTQNINSIFDGGTHQALLTPTGQAFNPVAGQHFDLEGNPWTKNVQKFDDETILGPKETKAAQFGDAFFTGRRDAYSSYATPQLEQQYGDTNKELTFALDRAGLLNSSARAQQTGKLQQMYDINKQNVADQALSYETQARTGVEDARSNLISMLNATGDVEGASKSAIARATALSQPATYSPLGQLFTDFTAGLGVQAAQERSFAAGGPRPRYDTGLFGGAGRVVSRS